MLRMMIDSHYNITYCAPSFFPHYISISNLLRRGGSMHKAFNDRQLGTTSWQLVREIHWLPRGKGQNGCVSGIIVRGFLYIRCGFIISFHSLTACRLLHLDAYIYMCCHIKWTASSTFLIKLPNVQSRLERGCTTSQSFATSPATCHHDAYPKFRLTLSWSLTLDILMTSYMGLLKSYTHGCIFNTLTSPTQTLQYLQNQYRKLAAVVEGP